jgi:hypothetical protein
VASQLPSINISNNGAIPFSSYPSQRGGRGASKSVSSSLVTAQSVEFVAKPGEAHRAQSAIAPALTGALKDVTGFAGCIVMISDQEARLVTVVTFWVGEDRVKLCNANARWVYALLAPYLDRRLRVQTMVAQLPMLPNLQRDLESALDRPSTHALAEQEAEVCVA